MSAIGQSEIQPLDLIIRNGVVVNAESMEPMDVGIKDGVIVALGEIDAPAIEIVDAAGCFVVPGAIDVHTHFHHWVSYVGSHNADDYDTGTQAAASGGITTIINYAFQEEGEPLRTAVDRDLELAKTQANIDYGLHVVVTSDAETAVKEFPALAADGFTSVKVFGAVTGFQLPDSGILRVLEAAAENNILVNVHAEDGALIEHLTESFRSRGQTGVEYLPQARPAQAEAIATRKIAEYAAFLKAPVYFVHLSTAASLDAVREVRDRFDKIFVETRPVYLFLEESVYELPESEGNKFVCLPPIRSTEDSDALWEGLRLGDIDTYATDHAPWRSEQKLAEAPFWKIPAGVSNLQTSVPMLFSEGVRTGRLHPCRFVAVTSANPARLFGMYPKKGVIAVGSDADIAVIDPADVRVLTADQMHSKADYDPYEGYECHGWPRHVYSRGELVAERGQAISRPGRGQLIRRGPSSYDTV
ncbi:dihydropyrimidinase [Streptosporangium sp. NPDC006013]|uniref:dihydropyrimidinase n=1 Tax=Streptosporangium sp. NPDC006013 TaxID=3155596 RepID=UPI0033BA3085